MQNTLPPRKEIAPEHTWNAPSVFETIEAWEAECEVVQDRLSDLKKFQGRLSEGPSSLADGLDTLETLMRSVGKVYVYASMSHSVDTTDQEATRMNGKAQGIRGGGAWRGCIYRPGTARHRGGDAAGLDGG